MTTTNSVAVITGANAGLGFETARELARRGWTVVMAARDRDRGRTAVNAVRDDGNADDRVLGLELDLARPASVRLAAASVRSRFDAVQVLMNNAGLMVSDHHETPEGIELTWAVNHLGHFLFTRELEDLLEAGAPSRVVNVASQAHRMADGLDLGTDGRPRPTAGWDAYGHSKLCNILFTREMARRQDPGRVAAHAVHPGVVRTRFAMDGDTRGLMRLLVRLARPFMRTPADGARTQIWAATSPDLDGRSGRYYKDCTETTPTAAARDDDAARRLWEASERLLEEIEAR